MTVHDPNLGTGVIGQLSQLDDLEACVVIYLRLWCEGPAGRSALQYDLANGLGERRAAMALDAFATLFDLLTRHRRRPLRHHALQCAGLGADEACFAKFVALATSEDREDALWMAMLLVRPDMAPHLTAAASAFGLRIKQMLVQGMTGHDRPIVFH